MFHANIYGLLDVGMVILQLKFSHKETSSTVYSTEIEFLFLKTKKMLFEQPFGDLELTHTLQL